MPREACARALLAAAASWRLGMDGQAGAALAAFADLVAPLLAADRALAAALDPGLAALVAAQERGDPIGAADLVEHELLPRLLAPQEAR